MVMKAQRIIITILLLAVIVLCFCLMDQRRKLREMVEGRIATNLSNYNDLERGRTAHAQEILRQTLLIDVRAYDQWFGSPKGTNDFVHLYTAAQNIPREVVPGAFGPTNLPER